MDLPEPALHTVFLSDLQKSNGDIWCAVVKLKSLANPTFTFFQQEGTGENGVFDTKKGPKNPFYHTTSTEWLHTCRCRAAIFPKIHETFVGRHETHRVVSNVHACIWYRSDNPTSRCPPDKKKEQRFWDSGELNSRPFSSWSQLRGGREVVLQ